MSVSLLGCSLLKDKTKVALDFFAFTGTNPCIIPLNYLSNRCTLFYPCFQTETQRCREVNNLVGKCWKQAGSSVLISFQPQPHSEWDRRPDSH